MAWPPLSLLPQSPSAVPSPDQRSQCSEFLACHKADFSWANDRSNLDYTPGWDDRPSYNSKFGWRNGAQTSAFAAGNAGGGTTRSSSTQTRTSTGWNDDASSTSTRGPRTTSTNWNDNKANSTSSGSRPTQWNQHLAEGTASSSTTTAASSTSSAAAPTKTKVCRRGHLKRRSRNHS